MSTIRTRWRPGALRLFELVFQPWMKHRLAGSFMTGLPAELPQEYAVVLAANHVSWWDGFLLRELHRAANTSVPLLTLMENEQLERFPLFRQLGVVGIDRTPAGIRSAMQAVESFAPQRPWLTIFPQAHIWPSWKRPLGFEKGIARFSSLLAPALVFPVGIHLEPLTQPAPAGWIAAGEPIVITSGSDLDVAELETRVEDVLDFVHGFLALHGEAAPLHWPGLHPSAVIDSGSLTPSTV